MTWGALGLAAAMGVAGLAAGWAIWGSANEAPRAEFVNLDLPAEVGLTGRTMGRMALRPDGEGLVYVGPGPDQSTQLWSRLWTEPEPTPIPETEGAILPAFSPDGTRLAFVDTRGVDWTVSVLPTDGGALPVVASDSLVEGGGLSWGADGYIYFDSHLAGTGPDDPGDGLARVIETGARPVEPVSHPGPSDLWHSQAFPLPNGRGVLFYQHEPPSVAVVDLTTGEHRLLVEGRAGVYAETGHLVWAEVDGTLLAAPFDQDAMELTGPAVPLAENVRTGPFGGADFTIGPDGTLVYAETVDGPQLGTLAWVDRQGRIEPVPGEWAGEIGEVRLSPDGTTAAVSVAGSGGVETDIWVQPLDGSVSFPLTQGERTALEAWTGDGGSAIYATWDGGIPQLVRQSVDGLGLADPMGLATPVNAGGVSRDGRWLAFPTADGLVVYEITPSGEVVGDPIRLDTGDVTLFHPSVSPDGNWIAYWVQTGAGADVRVRPFPIMDAFERTVANSALEPRWSADGSELFYIDYVPESLVSVRVLPGPRWRNEPPVRLFDIAAFQLGSSISAGYQPSPEDDRFLVVRAPNTTSGRVVVVRNFFQLLRERVR